LNVVNWIAAGLVLKNQEELPVRLECLGYRHIRRVFCRFLGDFEPVILLFHRIRSLDIGGLVILRDVSRVSNGVIAAITWRPVTVEENCIAAVGGTSNRFVVW
jgi:hypothetical protein